ncbi:hypothetical protein BDV97DRAFT_402945 [Delphinella strobiligena]|nr:hypothetical protein BDV97DRAFT_402945 [Delphinella strobiligena]
MEKLKKILSPRHSKDDKVMYDDNTAGETTSFSGPAGHTTGVNNQATGLENERRGQNLSSGTSATTGTSGVEGSQSVASAVPSHLSTLHNESASTASIRSGIVGGNSQSHSTDYATGSTGPSSNYAQQDLPDRTDHSRLGGDAALAGGLATGSSRPGYDRHPTMDPLSGHQHKGHGHKFDGDPFPPGDEPQVPGYPHHYEGPHSTDTANRLDPHVPGEHTLGSGLDRDGRSGKASGSNLASGAAVLGTQNHEGRLNESSLTGTGGYDDQRFDPAATGSHNSAEVGSTGYPSSTSYPPGTAVSSEQQRDSHVGRDAALGTTAGAAGVGAYELGKNRSTDTGPASNTLGPHKSNALNVIDPRVQPEPEKMKGQAANTSGPYQSDTLNKVDPRVDDTETGRSQHHYGRDAAILGGAGAVGVGGYEATKQDSLGVPHTAQQPLATPTGAPQESRIFDQTQRVPDNKQLAGGWAKDTKAQEKLDRDRAKEAEKAHHKQEKAYAKEEKNEKKGGLLGFLHHDKTDKDTAEEKELKHDGHLREADQAAHLRHQRELEAGAAAGTVGVAGAAFEPSLKDQQDESSLDGRVSTDEKGHNRLHKDPPAKVQRELEEKSREQGTYRGNQI